MDKETAWSLSEAALLFLPPWTRSSLRLERCYGWGSRDLGLRFQARLPQYANTLVRAVFGIWNPAILVYDGGMKSQKPDIKISSPEGTSRPNMKM